MSSSSTTQPAGILYATDFSEPSRRALLYVKEWARQWGSPVRSTHVLDITTDGAAAGLPFPAARSSAEQMLRQVRRELRLAGVKETATLITAGKPADAIRKTLADYRLPLLAIGVNGTRRARPSLLGSTARALLETAPCPVLTVGTACPEHAGAGGLERILLVTDGAPASLRAAQNMWPLLKAAKPVPVYVIRSSVALSNSVRLSTGSDSIFARQHGATVEYGVAAEIILRRAKEEETELIVISRQAAGCLASLAPEGICHALATSACCPLLWLRADPCEANL